MVLSSSLSSPTICYKIRHKSKNGVVIQFRYATSALDTFFFENVLKTILSLIDFTIGNYIFSWGYQWRVESGTKWMCVFVVVGNGVRATMSRALCGTSHFWVTIYFFCKNLLLNWATPRIGFLRRFIKCFRLLWEFIAAAHQIVQLLSPVQYFFQCLRDNDAVFIGGSKLLYKIWPPKYFFKWRASYPFKA